MIRKITLRQALERLSACGDGLRRLQQPGVTPAEQLYNAHTDALDLAWLIAKIARYDSAFLVRVPWVKIAAHTAELLVPALAPFSEAYAEGAPCVQALIAYADGRAHAPSKPEFATVIHRMLYSSETLDNTVRAAYAASSVIIDAHNAATTSYNYDAYLFVYTAVENTWRLVERVPDHAQVKVIRSTLPNLIRAHVPWSILKPAIDRVLVDAEVE